MYIYPTPVERPKKSYVTCEQSSKGSETSPPALEDHEAQTIATAAHPLRYTSSREGKAESGQLDRPESHWVGSYTCIHGEDGMIHQVIYIQK